MANYEDLRVWQKAHELVLDIYTITAQFPTKEQYELGRQLRRAAASIPINLAEGTGRASSRELRNFANIARGSASEVEYELVLAKDLGYIAEDQFNELVKKIRYRQNAHRTYIKSGPKDCSRIIVHPNDLPRIYMQCA